MDIMVVRRDGLSEAEQAAEKRKKADRQVDGSQKGFGLDADFGFNCSELSLSRTAWNLPGIQMHPMS